MDLLIYCRLNDVVDMVIIKGFLFIFTLSLVVIISFFCFFPHTHMSFCSFNFPTRLVSNAGIIDFDYWYINNIPLLVSNNQGWKLF